MERAIFDMTGGTCTGCSLGIEHMARRIKGVEDVWIDRKTNEIFLDFDGNPTTVEKIENFVKALGYEATCKATETVATSS